MKAERAGPRDSRADPDGRGDYTVGTGRPTRMAAGTTRTGGARGTAGEERERSGRLGRVNVCTLERGERAPCPSLRGQGTTPVRVSAPPDRVSAAIRVGRPGPTAGPCPSLRALSAAIRVGRPGPTAGPCPSLRGQGSVEGPPGARGRGEGPRESLEGRFLAGGDARDGTRWAPCDEPAASARPRRWGRSARAACEPPSPMHPPQSQPRRRAPPIQKADRQNDGGQPRGVGAAQVTARPQAPRRRGSGHESGVRPGPNPRPGAGPHWATAPGAALAARPEALFP